MLRWQGHTACLTIYREEDSMYSRTATKTAGGVIASATRATFCETSLFTTTAKSSRYPPRSSARSMPGSRLQHAS
jgi:hypothetical protein